MSKEAKEVLRRQALACRDALPHAWRERASMQVAGHGTAALTVTKGAVVAGFLPIRSEVDPRPLMLALAKEGATLALPAILDAETIVFRQWDPSAPLIDMAMKTQGPGPEWPELTPDIILMPLAGFDAKGNRLGYGGGFYDRAIARMALAGRQPKLIGIAFQTQALPAIPAEAHDRPIDAILTEEGFTPLG